MTKYLIGTHDSATGEKGKGFISWLLTPFAKTQRKTIREQYEAGCRYFDIRVRLIGTDFYCAHGPWRTKRTARDILYELNNFDEDVHVEITYEGTNEHEGYFKAFIRDIDAKCYHVYFTAIAAKYGEGSKINKVVYGTISVDGLKKKKCYPCTQCFNPLDGRDWKIYLPIPWLWKKLGMFKYYNSDHIEEWSDDESVENAHYKLVDFL